MESEMERSKKPKSPFRCFYCIHRIQRRVVWTLKCRQIQRIERTTKVRNSFTIYFLSHSFCISFFSSQFNSVTTTKKELERTTRERETSKNGPNTSYLKLGMQCTWMQSVQFQNKYSMLKIRKENANIYTETRLQTKVNAMDDFPFSIFGAPRMFPFALFTFLFLQSRLFSGVSKENKLSTSFYFAVNFIRWIF